MKEFDTVTFLKSIKDVFPYVESTLFILDNNFNWWKKNYEKLEKVLVNAIGKVANKHIEVKTKFTIYNGPDESGDVTLVGPAIEFKFLDTYPEFAEEVKNELKNELGGNSWEGHKILVKDNKIFVFFE